MNFFSFFSLLAFIVCIFFGLFVLYTNIRYKLNRFFAFLSFFWAIWALSDYLIISYAQSTFQVLLFSRFSILGAMLTALFFLFFCLELSREKFHLEKKYYIALILPILILALLNFTTDLIFKDVILTNQGYDTVDNWFYAPAVLLIFLYVFSGLCICLYYRKKIDDVRKKKQASLIILAISLPAAIGFVTELIPSILNYAYNLPIASSLSIFSVIVISYATVKYKFLATETINIQKRLISGFIAIALFVVIITIPFLFFCEEKIKLIMITGPIFIVSLTAGYYTSKKIAKAIINLRILVEEVGCGEIGKKETNIKKEDELDNLAFSFMEMAKKLKDSRDVLEERVKEKTSELKKALEIARHDKQELEAQRKATLNILDDVSDSESKIKEINKKLEKTSQELILINRLNKNLSGIIEIEEAIRIFNPYLSQVVNFKIASYVILGASEEKSLVYTSFINQEISEDYLEYNKKELISYISKNNLNLQKYEIILKNIKPKLLGRKLNNNIGGLPQETVCFPLGLSKNKIGIICLSSSEKSFCAGNDKSMVETMLLSFSLSLERLLTLLKSQQSKTNSLIESLSDGIIMVNNSKELVLLNSSFTKQIGLNRENFNFLIFSKTLQKKGVEIEANIDYAINSGKMAQIKEIEIGDRFFELFFTPVKDGFKKIVGCAVIFHDITYLKEIDRMKTEFVSVASHQLRTPLTSIKLFAEMLNKKSPGEFSKEQSEYILNIQKSTERMVRLVNDLLNVARIESGRLIIDPRPTDIIDLIKSIIFEIKSSKTAEDIDIKFVKAKNEFSNINLDQSLIRQVIHNLIMNAIRYSDKNKRKIAVAINKEDEFFIISVEDNGIGIPEKFQKNIFSKFYRADNAVRWDTEGTGLGLYVAKMAVELSRGSIWFESKENIGTKFYIKLPLKGMKPRKGEQKLILNKK